MSYCQGCADLEKDAQSLADRVSVLEAALVEIEEMGHDFSCTYPINGTCDCYVVIAREALTPAPKESEEDKP